MRVLVNRRREVNRNLDWLILVASIVAFSTGLVLLTHLRPGDHRVPGHGLALRLDVHEAASLVSLVLIVLHIKRRWRFMARPQRPVTTP